MRGETGDLTDETAFVLATAVSVLPNSGSPSVAAQKRHLDQKGVISSLTNQIIRNAEDHVRATLRDPSSARFLGGILYRHQAVCGIVNAKNGYGGYTGDVVYLYVIPTQQVVIGQIEGLSPTDNERIATMLERYCHK